MLRRVIPAVLLLCLVGPRLAQAQYFGRNRVQYSSFDFKIIQTEHFDVYYYERERVAAMDAARMAERSYARLSKVLNHDFRERKPIILYASHSDFQQTNALGEPPSEGTGGVTDFQRNRAVMPFTGSYAEFADGPWLTSKAMAWYWDQYLPESSKRADLHVSPINATIDQLKDLPRTLLIVDENDVLRDEGEAYGRKFAGELMRTFWPSGSKAPRRHLYLSPRVGLSFA